MNKRRALKTLSILLSIFVILFLGILFFVFEVNIIIPAIISLLFIILLISTFSSLDSLRDETNKQIESDIDASISEALKEGEVGVLVYNEDYEVTWTSDFFREKNIDKTGEKLLTWLPDIQDVLQGNNDRMEVSINGSKYAVSKKDNSYVLIFKDITTVQDLNKKVADSAYVIGLLAYDNYDEINETEDDIQFINSSIKIPVMEYFKKYGVVYKTLRSSKMLLILNEEKYSNLLQDHFSILNKVRNESNKADLDITLSLSFARGSSDLDELDDEAQSLLELAQSRGGDQVAVKVVGGDTIFYGGSSEAKEKQSKTKVRVIYNSIKDQILNSSKVIIVGHSDMDADCVGAAICMSNVVRTLNKKSYIVSRTGGIESMISEVLSKYHDVLFDRHVFISQDEALNLYDDDTLVIMVDHHSAGQSNSSELLAKAQKIIIIDHHRRKADLDIAPLMVYVEASASSTCELTAEFLQYLPRTFELTNEEANIMYLGILIDTDRFRVRTGARTFDALKNLKTVNGIAKLRGKKVEEIR